MRFPCLDCSLNDISWSFTVQFNLSNKYEITRKVDFLWTVSNQIYEEHSPDLFGEPSGGDESGCVKPWLGAVKNPKNPPPINPGVPGVKMKLKWVHGYASGIVLV